jgi:DNA-binding MarR family transcriptional regulator
LWRESCFGKFLAISSCSDECKLVQARSKRAPDRKPASPAGETGLPEAFANLIGYHLRIAQEASFQAIRQAAGKSDLKPGWYTILSILSDNPGLTPTELSRLCGRDRSTLTSTLKGLNDRGFISRRHTPQDQRSYSVRLTAAGEAMLRKLRVIAKVHDARLDAIVGKDKRILIALLRRISETLGQPAIEPRRARRIVARPRAKRKSARAKAA